MGKWSDGAKAKLKMRRNLMRAGVTDEVIQVVMGVAAQKNGVAVIQPVKLSRIQVERVEKAVAADGKCAVYRSKRSGNILIVRGKNVDVRIGTLTHDR